MTRPARYKENNSSRDWIDEFCATSTVDESRGAFRFTIGKYLRRYGKKDDPLQEALKIQDYANRLVEFERAALMPGSGRDFKPAMAPDFGQSNTISYPATPKEGPDVSFDGDSARRKAIDQNGNDGAVYGELDRLRAAADFNDDIPVEPQRPRHVCPACGLGHSIGQCNPMTVEEAVALGGKPITEVAE